jgi:hypothetical protein
MSPLRIHDGLGVESGRGGGALGDIQVDAGLLRLAAHQTQLPNEQSRLRRGDAKQEDREQRKPIRIVRDPLRFESELFVNFRFLLALMILLVGFLLGIWGWQYFYRERYLIGAALIGCGWLCTNARDFRDHLARFEDRKDLSSAVGGGARICDEGG